MGSRLRAMRRSNARIRANANSATAIEFFPGQLETYIPRPEAAATLRDAEDWASLDHSWFASFAPSKHPEIAVVANADDPMAAPLQKGGSRLTLATASPAEPATAVLMPAWTEETRERIRSSVARTSWPCA